MKKTNILLACLLIAVLAVCSCKGCGSAPESANGEGKDRETSGQKEREENDPSDENPVNDGEWFDIDL